jgi:two-component system, sensor histidine kinase and response regulator
MIENINNPLILIGDDDLAVSRLLTDMLSASGYATETALDGDEVLAKVESTHPDLILLDVTMPCKDGYEILRILQRGEKTKDIPVIMVTGRADVPDRVAALHLGAEDYLVKPFSMEELLARVRVHLKTKKGMEEKIRAEKILALSTMVDGMAHEVRNPLTVIGGFARILMKKTEPSDPRYYYMAAIARQVSRLEKMVKDIQVIKDITLDRSSRVVVNTIVRQVLQSMSGNLSARNVNLALNLDPTHTKLLVDTKYFKMGLRNIIQNAIEAMASGGRLSVTTRRDADRYYIHVADVGSGINEDDLRRVFDPFFTSKMEGTGLGLTMAFRIFRGHDGNIFIRSTPGVGTEVVVECSLEKIKEEL